MLVRICVGSSCHLKGAPQVIAAFQDILARRPELAARVELGACYCQDRCQEGVIVSVDGKVYCRVTPGMVESILEEGGAGHE